MVARAALSVTVAGSAAQQAYVGAFRKELARALNLTAQDIEVTAISKASRGVHVHDIALTYYACTCTHLLYTRTGEPPPRARGRQRRWPRHRGGRQGELGAARRGGRARGAGLGWLHVLCVI